MARGDLKTNPFSRAGKGHFLAFLLVFGTIFTFTVTKIINQNGQEPAASAAVCTVSDKLVNSCRPWLGATTGGYSQAASNPTAQFNFFNKRLNNPQALSNPNVAAPTTYKLDLVHTYHRPDNLRIYAEETTFMNQAGTYIFMNYKPALTWASAAGGNAGVNADIDTMANAIKAVAPKKIMLAIFHEPEDDVSSAPNCSGLTGPAGSTTDYVNMWRNVRSRFDARGVNNVVWVMNYMGFSNWNCMVNDLYPGDAYVDWIMWDPYADSADGSNNSRYDNSMKNLYNFLNTNSNSAHNYNSKIWGLAEHGVRLKNGTTQSVAIKYWNDWATAVTNNTYPKLKAFVVFDTTVNGTSQIGYDFNGNISIEEQTAYNNFAKAIFAKEGTTPPPPPPGDTTKPTVTITSPAANATVTGSITINVQATDSVGVTRVDIFWDNTLIRNGTSQGTYGWGARWDSTTAPNGARTLRAVAYDAAGNSATHEVPVTVSNGPTAPANPSITSFTASPSSVVAGSTSTLSWVTANTTTCSVNPGGTQNTTNKTWTTMPLTTVGSNTFTLVCRNSAGVTASRTVTITVTAAPTAPTSVTLTASPTNIKSGDLVTFSWTSSGGATSCVLNPGNYVSASAGSSRTIAVTQSATYRVTCSNNIGSRNSNAVSITVTQTPPLPPAPVINTFTATPADIANGATSVLSWTSSNIVSGGCSLTPSSLTSTSGNNSWTTPALTNSTTFVLLCRNSAGATTQKEVSVKVAGAPAPPAPQPQPPTAPSSNNSGTIEATTGQQVVDAQNSSSVNNGELVTLDSGTVADEGTVSNIVKVEFYNGQVLVATVTEPPFAFDSSVLGPGTYTITQRTYYEDGSTAQRTQEIVINQEEGSLIDWTTGRGRLALAAAVGGLVLLAAFGYWWVVLRRLGYKFNYPVKLLTQKWHSRGAVKIKLPPASGGSSRLIEGTLGEKPAPGQVIKPRD